MWNLAQILTWHGWGDVLTHIPILLIRTLITFITVLSIVRWTGKRSISNLAPFDLAMVIMIGEVAAIPVAELDQDLLHGILPVAIIGTLHVLTTTLALHSKWFERLTEGVPTMLVKDGRVLRKNLLKERVSMADLLTAMRHKEVTSLGEVKEAWIEHAGGISVIRKPEADSATPNDLARERAEEIAELEQVVERIVQAHSERLRDELKAMLCQRPDRPGG